MISKLYKQIRRVVESEFSDILEAAEVIRGTAGRIRKLRLHLIDNTLIDIWYAIDGSYSYHWEQRSVRDAIYRHDNAPHQKWSDVSTFPKHCHDGEQNNVTASFLPDKPEDAVIAFFSIVRERMISGQSDDK
jgi:hypothetical protein